jgi:hypothetical protein
MFEQMNTKNLARQDVAVEDVEPFVRAGCGALGLELDETALQRVAGMFALNARIASLVMSFDLPEAEDPLPLTRLD